MVEEKEMPADRQTTHKQLSELPVLSPSPLSPLPCPIPVPSPSVLSSFHSASSLSVPSCQPQVRFRASKQKRLLLVTLRILLFFWHAGKFAVWKTSQSRYLQVYVRKLARLATAAGGDERYGNLPATSTLRFKFGYGGSWKKILPRKMETEKWKMTMKQIYGKMFNRFLSFSKLKDPLHLVNGWRGNFKQIFAQKPLHVLKNQWKKQIRRNWKIMGREVDGTLSGVHHLQKFQTFRGKRKNLTWGEIVHARDKQFQTVIRKYNTRLQLYRKLPLRSLSRLWGQFNEWKLPIWLRSPAIRLYVWLFDCRLEEAAVQDLTKYSNIGEFFRRGLRPGVRPIARQPLTSPADGTVLFCGLVKNNTLEQVKGVTYSLEGFLGPLAEEKLHLPAIQPIGTTLAENSERFNYGEMLLSGCSSNNLYQCIIYLAPGDYHRFHSPADWNITSRRHFPGELFSVNPSIARWLQGLFSFNERAVYSGRWVHGFMSLTAVGATNVGSINVYCDQDLSTNVDRTWPSGCYHDKDFTSEGRTKGIRMTKGQAFGHFSLGSTVVLLFEAPPSFQFGVKPGQKLKYGQGIGRCVQKTRRRHKVRRLRRT